MLAKNKNIKIRIKI